MDPKCTGEYGYLVKAGNLGACVSLKEAVEENL